MALPQVLSRLLIQSATLKLTPVLLRDPCPLPICFPAPLRSTGITPLLHYYGCSEFLLAALRVGTHHEHRPNPTGPPAFTCILSSRPTITNHPSKTPSCIRDHTRECRTIAQQTSPLGSRLVSDTKAESCSLVIMVDLVLIRCFLPHLAVTQLLRVLASTTAAGGLGLSPKGRTPLRGAPPSSFQP